MTPQTRLSRPSIVAVVSVTLLSASLLATDALAQAQFKPWSGASIVRDPEWQKSFLGSYGFLSGAEPPIRPAELEGLKEVLDLLKLDPQVAAVSLEGQIGPDSSAALHFILANLKFQVGETDAAIANYEAALEKFPDFRRARKNLGLLMVQMNEYAGAIQQLTRAIELGERDGRAYGLLGYCYVNVENPVAAESAYRNAILQQPDARDWQLGLARALLQQEKYREAVSLFSAVLEKHPDDASAWKLQANAYLGLEQPRAAAVNLEAVRMLGQADASTLQLLGDIYMNEGINDLAKEAYLAVIEADAGRKQYQAAFRAAELLNRAQAHRDASDLIGTIRKHYAAGLDRDRDLELQTLEAKVARALGRESEAAKLLESIVEKDGTRGGALLELAQYHVERGNEQRALLLFERAQKLEKFEYPAYVAEAQYRVGKREYDQAAQLLKRALQIRSEPRVERFLARVEEASRR